MDSGGAHTVHTRRRGGGEKPREALFFWSHVRAREAAEHGRERGDEALVTQGG